MKEDVEKLLLQIPINEPLNLEQLTPEIIDELIKPLEESIKEMEGALLSNVEWISKKREDEIRFSMLKNEEKKGWKGWFWEKMRQRVEDRLKRNNYKPPKKLSKISREVLEEKVRENKNTITFMKRLKEEMIKDPTGWMNKKAGLFVENVDEP